jgi:hypothetical protein
MLHMDDVEKENSAVRIHRIFERMMGTKPENSATLVALSNALGLDTKAHPLQQTEELSRAVSLLFKELNCMIEDLKPKHSPRAFRPVIAAFERLSPAQLVNQWQGNKPVFQASLDLLFSFGEELENEGSAVTGKDLTELKDAVKQFREDVQKSKWPADVKKFVAQQLDIILRAVAEYQIAGVKAFKASVRDIYFHQAEHIELVKQHADSEPMTRLKALQFTVLKWSQYVIEAGKLLAAGDSISTHAEKAAHATAQVLHHAGSVVHNLPK